MKRHFKRIFLFFKGYMTIDWVKLLFLFKTLSMKQLYVFFLLIVPFFATAQVINFADVNFKNALLASDPNNPNNVAMIDNVPIIIDANQNSEIEQNEVAQITTLMINDLDIVSLDGIQYFTNLKELYCERNAIISLDLRSNIQLKSLDCYENALTSLDLRGLDMQFLLCYNNRLSELLYDANTTNWLRFVVANNQLTSIVIPKIQSWDEGQIDISGNLFTEVNFPTEIKLFDFYCVNSQLTSLDLSNVRFADGRITDNANLQFLSLKNGALDYCFDIPGDETGPGYPCMYHNPYINNNPALQFLCVDDISQYDGINRVEVTEAEYFQDFAPSVSSYCSFTPGGTYNTITGTIKFDADADGCNAIDPVVKSIKIMQSNSDSGSTFTNQNGLYTTYINFGNMTLTPQFENPYYSVSPASFTSAFTGTGNTETVDFCIVPNGIHADLEVSIVPVNNARPGFDATYHIIYKNKGNQTLSGNITLDFDDSVLDFVSANPVVNAQPTNRLVWNFGAFAPFASKTITVTFNVNSPMETPAVNIDDILHFTATAATSQTDETPLDNIAVLNQTVLGSFDPNDKLVAEGEAIGTADVDKYLHYTIRFQNTGTFEATNVVVTDVIQGSLDANSLQIVSASHPYVAKMSDKKLEFIFEGIDLPTSSINEPGSHGYITFKIKPATTVALGSTISNIANIYFDYNFPIETNPVTTTVTALATAKFGTKDQFLVYPNPVKNLINIDSKNEIMSATIYTLLGQTVKMFRPEIHQTKIQIPAGELKAGTYLLEIHTANGKSSQKLIKL